MVAPAGAGPWPQITSGRPLRTSNRITGTSPPGPLRCGSTTWSVKAVAQAASKALPPFSRIDMPTAVAIQWVEVTTANVPSISGRVVKGLGLTLLMRGSVPGGLSFGRFAQRFSVYHVAELRTLPLWPQHALLGGALLGGSGRIAGRTQVADPVEAHVHKRAADGGRLAQDLLGRCHHGQPALLVAEQVLGRHHDGEVLDRARPDQGAPGRPQPGLVGAGRHEDDLGAPQRQRARDLRHIDLAAHGEPDLAVLGAEHREGVAGH